MERNSILLSSSASAATSSVSHFSVTPYKMCVSVIIYAFCDERSLKTPQREIGQFCVTIMRLIQGLDCTYNQLIKEISPPNISTKINKKINDKLIDMTTNGLTQMMELVTNVKQLLDSKIQRSSIIGLFIRRIYLYFDKLTFSAVSQLYTDFVEYVRNDDPNQRLKQIQLKQNQKSDACPQQMQYFISKQINLMQVNEQMAMSPHDLLEAIKFNCDDTCLGVSSPQNELNDVHFLLYINSIRINEYPATKESLMAYFDGNSNQTSRCWAALNLAILHSHFDHFDLSLEALKESISAAQESNDDKCLEYALLWIARILSQNDSNSDVTQLLNHLQSKANESGLPYISSVSQLHSDKLKTLNQNRSNGTSSVPLSLSSLTPDILAVKHSMNDVLLMTYASRTAIMNYYGAYNLAALTSQVLLHLNVVEPIGEDNVYFLNENTCIGVRNIALHLWRNSGQYHIARDMLIYVSTLFSSYKSNINTIWRESLAEIDFEYHLNQCNWKGASDAIQIIRMCNQMHANLRLAQLKVKRGDKLEAIKLLNQILECKTNGNSLAFIKVNAMLLNAKVLNDITIILECIDLTKQNHLTGLECSCLVQLALMLHHYGQIFQSTKIINSIMIKLLANGTCYDIATAYYTESINQFSIYKSKVHDKVHDKVNTEECDNLDIARLANEKAIDNWRIIGDKESLKDSLMLQANIYHYKKDFLQRNFYARQLRLLQMEIT